MTEPFLYNELLLLTFALLGAVMGSFVNMAASRLPEGGDLVFKKSHCPKCKKNIRGIDLIPIISWVLLGGKCRNCKASIGVRYLLTEIALLITFSVIYLTYGVSAASYLLMAMAVVVAIIVVVDFERYIIPDSCQIALLLLGCVYVFSKDDFTNSAIGSVMGLTLGLGLRWYYMKFLKKDALGLGDVKLLAVSGLWLGWLSFVPFIFYSGLLGVLSGIIWTRTTGSKIFPFGPALAITLFLLVCFPHTSETFWQFFNGLFSN